METISGITFIALGGFVSAAYYLPFKFIKEWRWETGWLVYVLFAFLIAPCFIAIISIPGIYEILQKAPLRSILLPFALGIGYGLGGLSWGLSIRYLGIGIGNIIPLGTSLLLSTFIAPMVPIVLNAGLRPHGLFKAVSEKTIAIFEGASGNLLLLSVCCSLAGIILCGIAASKKDKDQKKIKKSKIIEDFNLSKGVIFALFGGLFSSFFTFGEYAGNELTDLVKQFYPSSIWHYNAVYAIILFGGLVSNITYCFNKAYNNKSYLDFTAKIAPLLKNYSLAVFAGILWISMFVFKGIGTIRIPTSLEFITWSLLFTFLIAFSNLLSLITKEWIGTRRITITFLIIGLLFLITAAVMIGMAGYYNLQ